MQLKGDGQVPLGLVDMLEHLNFPMEVSGFPSFPIYRLLESQNIKNYNLNAIDIDSR